MHLGFTVQAADISIHALREEGDSKMYGRTVNDNDFYPRPPRGGRRPSSTTPISSANFYPRPPRGGRHPGGVGLLRGQNFYPRPPRGGRLRPVHGSCKNHKNFYPRPPRGGRRFFASVNLQVQIISIHALREEGDPSASRSMACSSVFLSTPSARRATLRGHPDGSRSRNFYPRPPRGGRPAGRACCGVESLFLSTPSARRATWASTSQTSRRGYFYPRPPRGGRRTTTRSFRRTFNFYPLPPRGGRPRASARRKRSGRISIHALREEGD